MYAVPALTVLATSCFLYTCQPLSSANVNSGTIVFYKQGSLDWNTPAFGSYGQRSGGMFGLMPQYLKAVGFNPKFTSYISPQSLADADVVVIINLNKPLKRKELFSLWSFVKNGGGLLLLGDHTNLGRLMVNFNQILKDVPIKFNFDSVMPSRYTWDYLMDIRTHGITNGFEKELAGSWWVGASLKCTYPAIPLVTGKYCYSDLGYKHNVKKAYLGNRRFDYYERTGDIVLAALASYGKGRVMVCGDTSAFHNTTFMTTHPFIINVFKKLSEHHTEKNLSPLLKVVPIFLILSLSILILFCFMSRPNLLIPLLILLVMAGTVCFSVDLKNRDKCSEIPFDKVNAAFIDSSHFERFDLMSWESDSIGGLKNNLHRNGLFPYLLTEFDSEKIMKAGVLIIIAPSKAFTEKEVEILKVFAEKGGKIIITVGWEESHAALSVLKGFGFEIDNIPLAWCRSEYRGKFVQFREAWPVSFKNSENVKVICKALGYPVVVCRRTGDGSITVIGDSRFLLNENLEGSKKFFISNIFLLRDILIDNMFSAKSGERE